MESNNTDELKILVSETSPNIDKISPEKFCCDLIGRQQPLKIH